MKNILLLLFCIIGTICNAQISIDAYYPDFYEIPRIKGNIKNITTYICDTITYNPKFTTEYKSFDNNGNEIESIYFNTYIKFKYNNTLPIPDSLIRSHSILERDEHGNMIKYIGFQKEDTIYENVCYTYFYKYNSGNKIVEYIQKNEDDIVISTKKKIYNSNNLEIKYIAYDNTDSIITWITYLYNEKNQLIEQNRYNKKHEQWQDGYSKQTWKYDSIGNVIEKKYYVTKELKHIYEERYRYNNENKIIKSQILRGNLDITNFVYPNNSDTLQTSNTDIIRTATFDKFDNIIDYRISRNIFGEPVQQYYIFEGFDEKNNWIKCIEKNSKNQIIKITERKIEYYN